MGAGEPAIIQVLGEFQLIASGVQLQLQPSAQHILAWLAMRPSRCGTRSAICSDLWPDLDERTARARLSQGLWKIRSRLEGSEQILFASTTHVRLAPSVVVDIEEIWNLGSVQRSGGIGCSSNWELLGRPLCPDWDEMWMEPIRESVNRALNQAMQREVELLAARNDLDSALSVASKRVQIFSHDELAFRSLITLQEQVGDIDAARATFALLAENLLEIGSTPSPDLVQAQVNREQSSAAEMPSTAKPTLVGRGDERAALITILKTAKEGFGSTVILEGEAGIGKSCLMDQFVLDAMWRGVMVGQARCTDIDAPLAPLRQAVQSAIAPIEVAALVDALDKPSLWRAARLLPGLEWPSEARMAEPDPPSVSDDEHQMQVQSLVEVLRCIARRRLVCIALDDIHTADPWTLSALHRLAELVGNHSILIVVCFRFGRGSEGLPPELDRLDALPQARRIKLQGLTLRGTYELALQLDERITRAGAKKLLATSRGNPLLICQLVDQLESTAIDDVDGAQADPIIEKLRTISALESRILHVLAVAEESLSALTLASINSATSPQSTASAVLALVEKGLIIELRGDYRTAHDLIAVAALGSLTAQSRREIASSLLRFQREARTPPAAARLATWAGDWERAAIAHQAAGSDALTVGAVRAASQHYEQAAHAGTHAGLQDDAIADILLALYDTYTLDGDADRQGETMRRLNRLNARDRWQPIELRAGWHDFDNARYAGALEKSERLVAGGYKTTSPRGNAHRLRAEVRVALNETSKALEELQLETSNSASDSPELRAELLTSLAKLQVAASDGDLGASALQEAVSSTESAAILVDARLQFGMSEAHAGKPRAGFDSLQSALALAKRLGDKRRQAECEAALGSAFFALFDRYGSGRPHLLESLELAQSSHHLRLMAKSANNLGFGDSVILGRISSGVEYLEQAIEWALSERASHALGFSLYSRGQVAFSVGDEDSAIELYEQAEQALINAGSAQPLEGVLAELAVLRARVGDFSAADRLVERAASVFRENSHREAAVELDICFAEVALLRGDPDRALAHATRVASSFRPGVHVRYRHLFRVSEVLRMLGVDDSADIHLGLAEQELRRCIADLQPGLRGEAVAHNAHVLRAGAALAERCTIVVGEDVSSGTPAGIRLEANSEELRHAVRTGRGRRSVIDEIKYLARGANVAPSLSYMTTLLESSGATIRKEFESTKAAPSVRLAP